MSTTDLQMHAHTCACVHVYTHTNTQKQNWIFKFLKVNVVISEIMNMILLYNLLSHLFIHTSYDMLV